MDEQPPPPPLPVDLTKYNTAAKICGNVFNLLKSSILQNDTLDINTLYDLGMNEIYKQCDSVYKKMTRKGPAFPISINLNNCIGNFTISSEPKCILLNDIVKIKLGVDLDGCIAIYGDTFVYTKENSENEINLQSNNYIQFLHSLKKDILKEMYSGNTNDEIKIMIESKCTDQNCFPITNCKSYQHFDDQLYNNNGKYMILNYKRIYDEKTEYLIEANECFELLENEVYTIEISVTPEIDDSLRIVTNTHETKLHRFNDRFCGLKLKTAKQFYSTVFKKHNYNVFNIDEYILTDIKHKLGSRECKNMNILETFPVQYVFNNKIPINVYIIAFTVCVRKENGALILKYF